MSFVEASRLLGGITDQVMWDNPDARQRILIARITGTFVGTLKLQTSDDGKTWSDGSVFKMDTGVAGNPTAPGVYAALLGASARFGRVIFSAYTSGSARIELAGIPQAP